MRYDHFKYVLTFGIAAIPLSVTPAHAREKVAPQTPALYQQLLDCRTQTDPTARLACYDARTAALADATSKRDVVIADKTAVEETRRGLFGFAAPVGKLMGFGGDDDDSDQIKQIDSTIEHARNTANGWQITLADGSVWEQNDTRNFILSPKVGNPVQIRRGALGTYRVSVEGRPSIKMRRVQ